MMQVLCKTIYEAFNNKQFDTVKYNTKHNKQ